MPINLRKYTVVLSCLIFSGSALGQVSTATFYGIFGANFLFLPIAGKLAAYSEEELFLKEVMIEGVISIQRFLDPFIRYEPY